VIEVARPTGPRPPIRRLSPDVVARIAAGEVVERPASVVKELVENAVDAGAREIRIEIENGGLGLIAVTDDGTGIPADELALAVERHATSKLPPNVEPEAIATLGFRGEALAAIAAVSRLRIVSRVPGEDAAHGIEVVGGAAGPPFVAGRPTGTRVEVRDLFFNTPARRKFLRTPAAEQVEVAGTVERLFLARPEVGLTFVAEGVERTRFPATTDLPTAAARVLGSEFAGRAVAVDAELPEVGGRLRAVLGSPTESRSSGQAIHLSVNGRTIQSRTLAQAVRQAYSDYLPRTRFPVAVLQLTLDPAQVDVNVHPTKREVRISRERDVADAVRRLLRPALRGTPHTASRTVRPPSGEPGPPSAARRATPGAAALPAPAVSGAGGSASATRRTSRIRPLDAVPSVRSSVAPTGRHPGLSLVGSLFSLYWVAEADGDLVLVDQHAASERVLYDRLRTDGRLARQELMEPVRVSLTARQAATLSAHAQTVATGGFRVEPFGGAAYRVLAVPVYRGHRTPPERLPELLDELADGGRPTVPDGLVERTAATIACHSAVRAGDAISSEEMSRILEALYILPDAAYACPHGRPVLVRLSRGQMDRWFLRSGAA
jgi:DNA mismatch repair protein MutL